jgi:hypothetical protein
VASVPEAATAQAAAEAKLAAAHRAMRKAEGLQFDFASIEPPKVPEWVRWVGEIFQALWPVIKWVFILGLAITAAFVLYVILREIGAIRLPGFKKGGMGPEPAWRPTPERARALLEDADRLAAEGRYEEAAHLLLFRSIDDLSDRKPGAVRPALTSRDIAQLDAIPAAARAAFGRIAEVVERSFFGGRPVGAEGFAECRTAYQAYAFAEGWT